MKNKAKQVTPHVKIISFYIRQEKKKLAQEILLEKIEFYLKTF